jgi:hypothetical protein
MPQPATPKSASVDKPASKATEEQKAKMTALSAAYQDLWVFESPAGSKLEALEAALDEGSYPGLVLDELGALVQGMVERTAKLHEALKAFTPQEKEAGTPEDWSAVLLSLNQVPAKLQEA